MRDGGGKDWTEDEWEDTADNTEINIRMQRRKRKEGRCDRKTTTSEYD